MASGKQGVRLISGGPINGVRTLSKSWHRLATSGISTKVLIHAVAVRLTVSNWRTPRFNLAPWLLLLIWRKRTVVNRGGFWRENEALGRL